MKVDKVLTRFAQAPEEERELRRVARALGNELPRHRLEVLRAFRAGLARVTISGDAEGSTYAAGYVAGILDLTAEYEVFVRQTADNQELQRMALREEWREVLIQLADGAKLPSELASRVGKDRPTVTRILKRLRTAGLVQSYANEGLDGRMRPHRLTVQGRRVLAGLGSRVSPDVERGISIAVGLFRHLVTHASSPASALDAIATAVLPDPEEASAAVSVWANQSKQAGLITELADPSRPPPPDSLASETSSQPSQTRSRGTYHVAATRPFSGPLSGSAAMYDDARNTAMWDNIPSLLSQLKQPETRPVYVRTDDVAWGAWAFALQRSDETGMSRAIVKGDILSQSIAPPERQFDLIYDDPAAIRADRDEPMMQEFMQRAEGKYVVASSEEEVPEDFIQLKLASEE